jgi:hypothetical protein
MNEKSLHFSENNLNNPHITLKKPFFPLKMSSKSLVTFIKALHLQLKASTSLKMYFKSLKIFQNASHYSKKPHITLQKPQFHCKCLQKTSSSLKKPQISNSRLHFCEIVFKKSRNFYKSLTLIIKPSTSLKMSLKSLKIF